MKTSFRSLGLYAAFALLTPSSVHSFPTAENMAKIALRDPEFSPEKLFEALESLDKRSVLDPLGTPISVTGVNAFQAPNFTAGDTRGPCTGLNAPANHGYLSRDGAVSLVDSITAVNTVFGMGIDLGSLLAVVSTLLVGNPVSVIPKYSIGGVSAKIPSILTGVTGPLGLTGVFATPQGIDVIHNAIETDGSSTRDDIYVTGNAWTMNMTKFLEVYNAIPVNGAMTMDDIYDRSAKRFDESVATNPYFYHGPYTGLFARHGGYMFNGRLLSNHSTDYPRGGHMTRDVYASFCGVYPDGKGGLVYKEGWEQIPANWYRIQGDYSFLDLAADAIAAAAKHPQLFSIGGNMGAVNTFAGIDIANVTGGVLNLAKLAEGNNLLCFSLEAVQMFLPNQLASVFATISPIVASLSGLVSLSALNLTCPIMSQLTYGGTDLITGLMNKYPGAARAGSGL